MAIAASNDGTVTIRDGDGEIQTMSHGSPIRGLTLFPDGRFVTGGADGLLKCWTPGLAANLAVSASAEPASARPTLWHSPTMATSLLYQNFREKHSIGCFV